METARIRSFGLLIAFSLIASDKPTLEAQTPTTGRIRGQVREDKAGKSRDGIPGVTVTLRNEKNGLVQYDAVTDRNGYYQLDNVHPGDYTITADCRDCVNTGKATVHKFRVYVSNYNFLKPPPLALGKGGITQTPPGAEQTIAQVPAAEPSLQTANPVESDRLSESPPQAPAGYTPEARPGPSPTTPVHTGVPQSAPAAQSPPLGPEYEQLVNTANAARGGNFTGQQLQSLPLSGTRTFDQLALLIPGVAPPPQTLSRTVGPGIGSGVGTSGQFAVNGLRSRANNFTVDGSDNNDEDIGVRRQGFTALLPQSIESLQEFYIGALLPPTQFGRNLGAQVNAVSRSGESGYHGTLYSFLTDRRLNARDAFDQTGGPARFPLKRSDGVPVLLDGKPIEPVNPVGGEDAFTRNQSGFVLGGPLVKDKTHFFGSYEHQMINADKESHFAVPTVAERGIFKSGDGLSIDQRIPRIGPQFPTSSAGDAFFSLYPFPNNPGGPYSSNTFTQVLPASARGDVLSFKLDHKLKAFHGDHILTGRYNFTDDKTILPTIGGALFSTTRSRARMQNLSLFAHSIFSNRVANELRFSYGRTRLGFDEIRFPCSVPSTTLPDEPCLRPSTALPGEPFLLNAELLENKTSPAGKPQFTRPGKDAESGNLSNGFGYGTGPIGQLIVSGYSPVGADVFHFPQARVNNTFQTADTLFHNLLNHTLIAGFDIRRTQLNSRLDRNFRSQAVFNGAPDIMLSQSRVADGRVCSGAQLSRCFFLGADFVAIGAPSGFYQTQAMTSDSTIGLRYWQNDIFFSDEIRLREKIVLTLGIRYSLSTVPREVNRRIESSFTRPEIERFQARERELTGVSGLERFLAGRKTIYQPDHNNLAPHIALAWDPFGDDAQKAGRMAIRAGYGIYYDQIPGAVITQSRNVFPNFVTLNFAGVPLFDPNSQALFNAFNPANLTRVSCPIATAACSIPSRTLNTLDVEQLRRAFGGRDLIEALLGLEQLTNFAGGPGFILPAADLVMPYSQHWGLTVEREFKNNFLFSVAYVGTRGVHLPRFATPNLGPNAIPVVDNLQGSLFPTAAKRFLFSGRTFSPFDQNRKQFLRPFPLLGSFTSIESDASSTYHSLQTQLNKRLSRGIQFTAAYTWSHAMDEASDLFDLAGGPVLPQNSFNRRAELASASFDVRHRFASSFIWDLPFFARNKYLGDWRIAGIGTFQTGQPFTLLACCDTNLDGNMTDRLRTTDGISVVNNGSERFRPDNPNDLLSLQANLAEDGAAKRNSFRAPGIAVIDLALIKLFQFKAGPQIAIRAEAFNLFNRTHFGMPVHQLLFPSLGKSVDTRLPARTIQFALKLSF